MSFLDSIRARAKGVIDKAPGKLGDMARKANDALGRPLADADELADRHAFEALGSAKPAPAKQTKPTEGREPAPVVVYHMDKTRRDATRLTEILDGANIPYKVSNIQEDAAAQMAVRRDSKGFRLPLVFIAGEVVGGRAELVNLFNSGELAKKVFG
jgi:glutaredoxin-related protein